MSIGAKCDLCGIPLGAAESFNVFRMWSGVRIVQIEDTGLQGMPYDENFYVCDNCLEKAYDLLVSVKVVSE